jgi:very-short-patch-repair endonuclease
VKNEHGLTKEQYTAQTGRSVMAKVAKDNHGQANVKNGDWIERAKEAGNDLRGYRVKMGAAVSKAVMANPEERARRSIMLGNLNRTDAFRKRSSETAILTSARPEIQRARVERLAAWRKRDPEAFYEKCVKRLTTWQTSKPEKAALKLLRENFPQYAFEAGQQLLNEKFLLNKTRRRQIDIMSKSHKIIVEIDGFLYFKEVWGHLGLIQAKDAELNTVAPGMGYTVIRISQDQWDENGNLSDPCKKRLVHLITTAASGLHFVGELYVQH